MNSKAQALTPERIKELAEEGLRLRREAARRLHAMHYCAQYEEWARTWNEYVEETGRIVQNAGSVPRYLRLFS